MKIIKRAGAVIVVIVLLAAIVLAVGIPSGIMTSAIQARIERETDYRIEVEGPTRVALWPTCAVPVVRILMRRAGS